MLVFKARVVRTWQAGEEYFLRHGWTLMSDDKIFEAAKLGL